MQKEIATFCPTSRQEWRQWLSENHQSQNSVWLIYYRKKSSQPSISWSEAVDEALCFGWIDSLKKTIDEQSFMQLFSKRKPKSVWSKINKEKIEKLNALGLITEAGYKSVEVAKQNGSWTLLDAAEELTIPDDLKVELDKNSGSKDMFLALSRSARKMHLQWLLLAKRPETRAARIRKIAKLLKAK
jgi:uncharacterized protein YdeI (YjbR/CyaY-like superfamily)